MSKVLIVDDEKDVLEALSSSLRRRGYEVEVCGSGEEGLELVKKVKFDVILLDIHLPGMDGVKTLGLMKNADPNIEAIMITGHGSILSVTESMKNGAYDYIEKPLNVDKICVLVERALERHQLTETVALYKISKAIFSTIEMNELLKIIVDLAMKVLRADDASLMLFDENKKLYIAFSYGLEEQVIKETRLAVGERIAGWVVENMQPVILINGLTNDARFEGVRGRESIKSSIVIPLMKNSNVLGILSANRINIEENFTKTDLYRSNIFASLVSLALDNAKMLSDLRLAHDKLKTSQQQLSQSAKLSALGKLVADMAHEVNNPLMIISGNAQICLMDGVTKEEADNNIKVIIDECSRAKGIIQRLLKFSRPSKGVLKKTDINNSLESVIKIIEHQFILSGVKIKRNFSNGLPSVLLDEPQIHEVFMNLLNNAKDAMEKGGEVIITTCCDSNCLRIDFKDSGCGMPEEALRKLFEPFFTTKEKGNGLGLSVCYGIIKAHNGELKFESHLGKGTTATILLPLEEKNNAQDTCS